MNNDRFHCTDVQKGEEDSEADRVNSKSLYFPCLNPFTTSGKINYVECTELDDVLWVGK